MMFELRVASGDKIRGLPEILEGLADEIRRGIINSNCVGGDDAVFDYFFHAGTNVFYMINPPFERVYKRACEKGMFRSVEPSEALDGFPALKPEA